MPIVIFSILVSNSWYFFFIFFKKNFLITLAFYARFLDFGLLCRMEKKHQFAMLASIVHIVNGDWASLVHALTEMDVVSPGTNIRRVTMVNPTTTILFSLIILV